MSFKAPNLDDRTFQQIVDEAKTRIATYCPEWTDHNDSDPGMTLIQLFAWMMDMLFYRMNQIPDLHYFKFLEFLGIQRQVPKPAQTRVTFWLTKAQENFDPIPAGTEVATTQTETEEALIFTTEEKFIIQIPQLKLLVTQDSNRQQREFFNLSESAQRLRLDNNGVNVFASTPPRQDDALYLGFTNDLSDHVLQLELKVAETRAAGGGRVDPPYEWHAYNNNGWMPCETDPKGDSTENLNKNGFIQLHIPQMHRYLLAGETLFWVRVRLKEVKYTEFSPRLDAITVKSIGCTIPVIHARPSQKGEEVGVSNGLAGQRFSLYHKPILKRRADENLYVLKHGSPPEGENWEEVADFADSTDQDKHYTLDSQTGEIRFGPAIRQTDGTFKQYGNIPPANAILYFKCYRYLEPERIGNVQRGKINTLKNSISYVKTVENRQDATGGREAESRDELRLRVARMLRTSQRAVTAADFERLATEDFNHQQADRCVVRAKCLTIKEKRQRLVRTLHSHLFTLLNLLKAKPGLSPSLTELVQQSDRLQLEIAALLKQDDEFALDLSELVRGNFSTEPEKSAMISQLMGSLLERFKEKADQTRPALVKLVEQQTNLIPELERVMRENNNFGVGIFELIRGGFAPDLVDLLVVPYVEANSDLPNRLNLEVLRRAFEVLRIKLEPFLSARCLLTMRLQLSSPVYQVVFVHISLHRQTQDQEQLAQRVLSKLYTFINPVTGGREHNGWPLGRSLQIGDIYDYLQSGEDAIRSNQIRQVRLFIGEENGKAKGRALDEVIIDPFTSLVSGLHEVKFGLL